MGKGTEQQKQLVASFNGKTKRDIGNKTALVTLSILGNEKCTGESLYSMLETATAPATHFKKTTFLIVDKIYYHNLLHDLPATPEAIEAAQKEALKIGDQYITNNLDAFLTTIANHIYDSEAERNAFKSDFQIRYPTIAGQLAEINRLSSEHKLYFEVIRWQEWMTSNRLNEKANELLPLFQTEETLHQALKNTGESYAHRRVRASLDAQQESAENYLAEEHAALAAAINLYDYVAYPGKPTSIYHAMRQFFIIGDESDRSNTSQQVFADHKAQFSWLEIALRRKNTNSASNTLESLEVDHKASASSTVLPNSMFRHNKATHNGRWCTTTHHPEFSAQTDSPPNEKKQEVYVPEPYTPSEQLIYSIICVVGGFLELLNETTDVKPADTSPLKSSVRLLQTYREERPRSPAVRFRAREEMSVLPITVINPKTPLERMAVGQLIQIIAIQSLEMPTGTKLSMIQAALDCLVKFLENNSKPANQQTALQRTTTLGDTSPNTVASESPPQSNYMEEASKRSRRNVERSSYSEYQMFPRLQQDVAENEATDRDPEPLSLPHLCKNRPSSAP